MMPAVLSHARSMTATLALSLALAACDRTSTNGNSSNSANTTAGSAGGAQQQRDDGAVCESCASVTVEADAAVMVEASAPAPDATAMVAPAVVGVAIAALRIRPTPEARGADATVDLELREDGAVYRRGQLVARFEGERLVDARSREVLRLASDRVVMIAGLRTTQRLTDAGDLRRPDGRVLHVEDDGRVVMLAPDGARDAAPMRIEGFRPASRATASLLLMYLALQP
jgi:hypothetical protein